MIGARRFVCPSIGKFPWVSMAKLPMMLRPSKAVTVFNIEHERQGHTEEVEFQFKWEH